MIVISRNQDADLGWVAATRCSSPAKAEAKGPSSPVTPVFGQALTEVSILLFLAWESFALPFGPV